MTIGTTLLLSLALSAHPPDTIAITGFESVEWGQPRGTVERVHGRPDPSGVSDQSWGTQLMYIETKFGATGFLTFRIHRTRGLTSGSYGFPFGSEDQCEDLFLGFRRTIEAEHGVPARDVLSRQGSRYCEGSRSGDTGARIAWSDGAGASIEIKIQGAMVVVEFDSGSRTG